MLKKLSLLLVFPVLFLATTIWAADFWAAKPFTDWNDKEVQKMLNDSPWGTQVSIGGGPDSSGKSGGGGGGGGKGKGKGGGGGGGSEADGGGDSGGGGGGGGNGGVTFTLLWQSALPVKQALVRRQFGAEAATSPDAKARLERKEQFYLFTVVGSPKSMLGAADSAKKEALLALTTMTVAGKPPIKATDVQVSEGRGPGILVFLFPRTSEFTVDDKEVEFATKFDKTSVKHKFKLKSMVFNGKLEM